MEKVQLANQTEATLGFALKFFLKLISLTLLLSIIPLLFVNLPLRMFFINFGSLYTPLMLSVNLLAIILSGSLAAKLIFAWGVSGFVIKITKEIRE